ncbi:PT domain-containing protein [Limosilactobacillus reuteri]|uniref:YSIRK-type signal peptide-containing protein n=1 Tax=Limosilactobacillus reuteri TaxID=1598 RepID=UPI001E57AC31|nr:PT domain-containing protein [Limosilactobacillus reuteri]MCC4325660.1 PT domain-containing protein [Limosilactobacillus reuteri]MCC4329605.1 PT domain-containing protein [Limosilactobacillus reuteri]
MSKNNAQEYVRKMEPQRQRFGLRKLSVGVASVLLGTTFMVGGTVAHADSNVNDNSIATINASDADNQDKQVTTSNHTAQDNVNFEANKTSESNVDDTQTSKDSTEDKIASTQESNQVQKDQSNNVTATTNKSTQDSKETTTLNLQSAQPVVKSALKESKAAEPTKQVTATLNIYDYKANDPKTPNVNGGEGVAFTYTGKFTDGLSIKDAIQAQIDADTQKQLAYKDQGTAIVPDKDGLPTEIGVSPVIYGDFTDGDLGGYHFRDETTATYTKDQSVKLVDDYNKWFDYKKANFALAGYKLADQDEQVINLDDPIEDGKTYNIYVNHQLSVVNVYHWTELKRTVEFKYYYNQNDKNATAADSITKNGYYNDGKYNSTQTSLTHLIDNSRVPQFSNLPSTTGPSTKISDTNSFETRLVPDDLKTTKDQNKVIYDTIYGRYVDLALGLITDKDGNLNNYGSATKVQPSGTVLFEGEPVKQIDNWHTFDPDVPDTGSEDINDPDTYSTNLGSFNKGTGDSIEHVDNPATTTIYYYHDQPVDITFEDVTNGDANASILSNFTASKQLRVDLNSEYIPGKPHTTPKDKKNNKNQKYETYSYQAQDNTYDTNAINVDPSGTLKSSKSLNYADVLKAYTDNGYALVSSDPDDLTYELEDVYDNNRNLQHKKRVVKLVHRAVAHTDTKTATRTIHYVANTKDGKQLQDDTTQNVTLTSSTYYTDAVTGNRVNAKQDANGDWIVDTANTDPVPAITWTVNADKSTGLTTDNKNFAAITTPETINLSTDEAAKRGTDGGAWYLVSTDKNGEVSYGDPTSDTWKSDTPNKIADGYLVYKQKAQYNIHYIDVNGVEDKTTYAPTDGHELTDRLVQNVGEGKRIFVGDTPDATSKLWSPADYEKAGYVLVGLSDNAKGDLLGKQTLTHGVQDQYVYLKHAVKTITPNTPVDEVPKNPEGNPIVDPSDLHKEFHRTIFYKANTTDGQTLMGQTDQKTEFNGTIAYDVVTGQTTTPETIKDANGKNVQVATTKAGKIEWNHETQTMDGVRRQYITLNKGDKYATSDDMVGTWHWISGTANEITLKPTSDNPEDLVLVYEKNKGESGPDEDHDLPKVDVKVETKTFTRTVVYRGTKDGGVHFESVNGSPDGKNTYKQTTTFTRNIFSTTDKDGKVTILETTPWTAKDDTLNEVVSQTPTAVGYELVDIEKVDAYKIDPNTDPENLGETIVTYSMKPKHETGPDEDHDLPKVDVKQETKTFTRTVVYRGTKDGGVHFESVNGSPDGKNTYKQTVTFTRNVFSTTDKDGKVTILEIDPWTAKDDTFGEVISKTPGEVGYDEVDIKAVNARTIDPDKDNPNLGTITVTYRATPAQPTSQPSEQPTTQPTSQPTEQPTSQPTAQPTSQPTAQPTEQPTTQPTAQPTVQPTEQPTAQPTEQPTRQPTAQPTSQPTAQPTEQPTTQPTVQPTAQPTEQPTSQPTAQPTSQPTVQPTEQPTTQPTVQPTAQPTSQPTVQPSEQPTSQPTVQPSEQPTSQPTEQPTAQPTEQPTSQPSEQPTSQPSEQPAIESNTQLPGEQKNEEPQPMTTQVTTKKGETSIVEPTKSSSTQPTTKQGTQQLPQTGNQKSSSLIGLGFAGLLSALGLTKVNKKRKD